MSLSPMQASSLGSAFPVFFTNSFLWFSVTVSLFVCVYARREFGLSELSFEPPDNPRDALVFTAHLYSCLHRGGQLGPCGRLGNLSEEHKYSCHVVMKWVSSLSAYPFLRPQLPCVYLKYWIGCRFIKSSPKEDYLGQVICSSKGIKTRLLKHWNQTNV